MANKTLVDGLGVTQVETATTLTLSVSGVEINVQNDSGSLIPRGAAVYATGVSAGTPTVALASNTSDAESKVLGFTSAIILNGASGVVRTSGVVDGLDTSGFSDGDQLYLGTAGNITATRPILSARVVNVGVVIHSDASNGKVLIARREAMLPNVGVGYTWVGDADGVPEALANNTENLTNDSDWPGANVKDALNEAKAGSDFMLASQFAAPVAAWPLASVMELGTAATFAPFVNDMTDVGDLRAGWETKDINLSIVSGALPAGMSLVTNTADADWSKISGTPTSVGSGSATIRSENVLGHFDYTLNWTVTAPNGRTEFLNLDDPYPSIRMRSPDFDGEILSLLDGVTGRINSSYVFDDSTNNVIYAKTYATPVNGYNYAYYMQHSSSSYWYVFRSNVAPASLVNGVDLVDGIASGDNDLVAGDADDFTFDGNEYSADDEQDYLTTQNYLGASNDSSFDGFLAAGETWSTSFKVKSDIPADYLGRPVFCRHGGNFTAWKSLGSSTTYRYLIYGRGASTIASSSLSAIIGTISAGTTVFWVYDGSSLKLRIGTTTIVTTTSPSIYWETAAANNLKDLRFGRTARSNEDNSTASRNHEYFQGDIEDLTIYNGFALSDSEMNTINGLADVSTWTDYATKVTHMWRLSETSGSVFAPAKGTISLNGLRDT